MRLRVSSLQAVWSLLACTLCVSTLDAARDSRLADAAKRRDRQAVRTLIAQRVDVNSTQPDGATPLHWATHWNDLESVDLLIRAGARVNAANDYGVTPLSLACTNGSAEAVTRLLKAGADPNVALPSGETVLMTAARTGNLDIITSLVSAGANVNATEGCCGQTALMWAASEGHAGAVQRLIDRGADVRAASKAGYTALLLAAREGDVETTRVLLAAGDDVNRAASDGTTALVIATIRGHVSYAVHLLDRGANPNLGPGFTPLHWAVGEWHTELTSASSGVSADDTEWSALGGLRGQAKLDLVKSLIAHGADVKARAVGNPRYSGAARGGNLAGGTPFLMAAKAGDVPIMRLLLDHGADAREASTQGITPLMVAAGLATTPGYSFVAEKDALEAVTLTLGLGNEINAVSGGGETPLHGAAYRGWNTVIQFLVEHGARINAKNKKGWTPLTVAEGVYENASYNVFPETVELLKRLGAEPSPPNVERDGTTILRSQP